MFLILFLILLANLKDGYAAETGICDEFWKEYGSDQVSVNISDCMVVSLKVDYPKNIYEAPELWKFTISTEKGELYFQLHKVDSTVFNSHARIHFSGSNKKEYIYEVAPNLENAVVYHDPDHDFPAALALHYTKNNLIVEGFIGVYALRYVHSRQSYILFKTPVVPPVVKTDISQDTNDFDLRYRLNPGIVHITLGIALDFLSVKNREHSEIIKNVLLYYNAVDLIYSNFKSPRIKISIERIVIPIDESSVHYLPVETDAAGNLAVSRNHLLQNTLYIAQNEIFQNIYLNTYKNITIIIMTELPINKDPQNKETSETFFLSNTYRYKSMNRYGYNFNQTLLRQIFVIRHNNLFGDHFIAAHVISRKLRKDDDTHCKPKLEERYPNTNPKTSTHLNAIQFRWSQCDVDAMRSHFNISPVCNEIWEDLDIHEHDDIYYKHFNISDCHVIAKPFNLPELDADSSKKWELNLEIENLHLAAFNLHKVDSAIFDKNTAVYVPHGREYTGYRKKNIYSIAPNLEKASVYHDPDHSHPAALVIYKSEDGNLVVEGFIGLYTLRYQHRQKKYCLYKMSLETDDVSEPKRPSKVQEPVSFDLKNPEKPNVAYVPLLIALDYTFVKNQADSEVLENLLLYYNAVDLIYAKFTSPQIKIHIKGIIIPESKESVLYLQENNDLIPISQFSMKPYFLKREVFSSYNNVIIMTGLPFANRRQINKERSWYGYGLNYRTINSLVFDGNVIYHPNFLGDYFVAAHVISNLLWRSADGQYYPCDHYYSLTNRYINGKKFQWCQCDVDVFSKHFSDIQSKTLEWKSYFCLSCQDDEVLKEEL